MNNVFSKSLVAVATLGAIAGLVTATPALADSGDSPWMVRVRLLDVTTSQSNTGNNVPTDSIKVADRVQPEIDASYFFTKNIAAEVIASYPLSHQVTLNGNYIGGLQELPPIANLQWHFDPMGAFIPYVGAGVMYLRTMNVTLLGGGVNLSQNNWGDDVQIGFDYKLDRNWYFNADVKKTWVNIKLNNAAGTQISTLSPDPVIAGVGIGYRF